jgi:hypothetical protein
LQSKDGGHPVRHVKRVALGFVVFGCFLGFANGLLGAVVLFGDAPEQSSLKFLAPIGIVLGLILVGFGNYLWQRERTAESHRHHDEGVGGGRAGADTSGQVARHPLQPARTSQRDRAFSSGTEDHVEMDATWTISELHDELERFERDARRAGLAESSVRTYVDRSRVFVRWLAGEYQFQGRR